MSNKLVRAIRSFDHYGMKKRGAEFTVSHIHAKQLKDSGLVVIVGETEQDPIQPAGRVLPSSASPAGQASPLTTSSASAPGGSEESSEPEESSETEQDSESEPPAAPPAPPRRPWQVNKKKR